MVTAALARTSGRAMRSFHKVFSGALARHVVSAAILGKTFNFGACLLTIRWTCRLDVSVTALAAASAAPDTGARQLKRYTSNRLNWFLAMGARPE